MSKVKNYVFNFGHALSENAKTKIDSELSVNFDVEHIKIDVSIDMTSEIGLEFQVLELMKPHLSKMMGDTAISIVSPGMSNAAWCVASIIHGLSGRFPAMIELRFDNETKIFDFHGIIDLQGFRNSVRTFRF